MNKLGTSVKIPLEINEKVIRSVVDKGYGLRGKSRWITEAIDRFVALESFEEYVDIASEQRRFTKSISFRLPEEQAIKLDDAIVKVRQKYPRMDAARSNIIRAAIIQHLLR